MSIEHLEVLYEALRAEYGVVVETNDAERLRQRLYALRRTEPSFTPLAFVISPFNGTDLWIVKKEQASEE